MLMPANKMSKSDFFLSGSSGCYFLGIVLLVALRANRVSAYGFFNPIALMPWPVQV
jgi:hypothetical protein